MSKNPLLSAHHPEVLTHREADQPARWILADTAGRLVEISGSRAAASLTLALSLVLEAQCHGELVGWTTSSKSFFYPPDAAANGIDLNALVVVCTRDVQAVARAGERLLRSGAFGLVVMDMAARRIPMPLQARLSGLARQHHTALVCVTEKEIRELSLSSLVSLRVHAQRAPTSPGRFACNLQVIKDKRRGPTWKHMEMRCGPAGLC